MATSEHTDEGEIAVSVTHSLGQLTLENATENASWGPVTTGISVQSSSKVILKGKT